MGRIARSWRLTKQSYRILMQDKELMLLPLFSMLAVVVVLASFVLGMGLSDESRFEQTGEGTFTVATFLFYVFTYTIGIFFQAAVIAGACQRLRGGNPTLGSALGAAMQRLPQILLWGLIAGTVGMIIRSIQERSELVGKIVMGLVGAVWSLAIFFMVPVLVMERQGVGASFKKSWNLFRKTWGETVVGNIGFDIVGLLLSVPIVVVAGLLVAAHLEIVGILVGVLGLVALGLFLSTLQGIWVASLYEYATEGETPPGYDPALFDEAFRPK